VALLAPLGAALAACGAGEPARYVGAEACASCHPAEHAAWRGSHHDLAMQEATPETALGDFDGARFERYGVVSTFFERDGRLFVNTEGADGRLADFEIAWSFGVAPLQQYLVRFPRGHVQALGIAWDARPREAGGQRWLHLYDERVPAGDVLHWTLPAQRWNTQCAACHSTNLRKGYHLAADAYRTTWSDIDVGCEACHGPGSRHAASRKAEDLAVRLPAARPDDWVFDAGAWIARLRAPRAGHAELETCAPCHTRRSLLDESWSAGQPFLDGYRPALLEAGLYHADGQMHDEVYVWGSFLQSRMHAQGVSCGDCHDAHALGLRAEGNALCAQCHRGEVFDAPAHHHHAPGSAGADCTACHMPARTYMQVDVRHDHSFRVPRPDLSVAIGTPNACTDCHLDRSAEWAARAVAAWFPDGRQSSPHFGTALDAGRRGLPGAGRALVALAADAAQPGIVRASALALLGGSVGSSVQGAVERGAADADPLVRLGALEAARDLEPEAQLAALQPLLSDPLLAVRIDAARLLAGVPPGLWDPSGRATLAAALAEYRAAQAAELDRPEAHLSLGLLALAERDPEAARAAYQTALRLAPWFVPARVNLADLERALGRDAAAEAVLRRGLELTPESPELLHALGLALVRLGRGEEALAALGRAAALAPGNARHAYAFALALHDAGEVERALAVLAEARARAPGDRDLLVALALFSRDAGRGADALRHARALVDAFPEDAEAHALLAELEAAAPAR
jgi:predicted CXXCH cytochrome family protein